MRLVVRLWMVRLIAWLWRMVRLIAWLRNISLPCLTVDIVLVVTGSDEFIEEGAVSAVKGVLFSVGVTEVINLTTSLGVCVVSSRVETATVEAGVGLGHRDGQRLDGLHLVRPLLQQDRTHGLRRVDGLGGLVTGRGRGSIVGIIRVLGWSRWSRWIIASVDFLGRIIWGRLLVGGRWWLV